MNVHLSLCAFFCILMVFFFSSALAKETLSEALPQSELSMWLETLSEEERFKAEAIVADHATRIQTLQLQIHQKLAALRALRFDSKSSPETLPRLGFELQTLKKEIGNVYYTLCLELRHSLGVCPKIKHVSGCCTKIEQKKKSNRHF